VRRFGRIPLVPLVALSSLLAIAVAAVAVFGLREWQYAGRPLPGTVVAEPRLTGSLDLIAATTRVGVAPGDLLHVDDEATRRAAVAAGRNSLLSRAAAFLLPLPPDRTVQPVLRVQPGAWRALLARLDRYGRPPQAATVAMRGLQPVVRGGRDGIRASRAALFAALVRHAREGQSPIHVRWAAWPPRVGAAEAGRAATTARTLLSAPIELRLRRVRVGSVRPAQLARLIRFRRVRDGYRVGLAGQPLASLLRPLVRRWLRGPVDASFRVDGPRVHVVPARAGLDLDAHASAAAILALGGETRSRVAALRLARVPARLTTAAARRLGVHSRLASYTTSLGAAPPAQAQRLRLLADRLDGTIVRRKQVFSFVRVVGADTLAGSLERAPAGKTAPDDAGARAVILLFAGALQLGLPILERHSFPVYATGYAPGREAAVSAAGDDLRFRNDLRHALLIAARVSGRTLRVAVYGTRQSRRVSVVPELPTAWTAPPLAFAVVPPSGRPRQRLSAAGEDGFEVAVERTVSRRGKVLRRDTFVSRYRPVGARAVPAVASLSRLYLSPLPG